MKVLNLQCSAAHGFEGWFASEDDFRAQLAASHIECPMCGDVAISKMPSAPRINLGAAQTAALSTEVVSPPVEGVPPNIAEMQASWLRMVREVIAKTEDVGERFPEEARRMHYGESEERGIRGQASRQETEALIEEGIGVLPLPVPKALKGPLH